MSEKKFVRCWKKGKIVFPSVYGVKDSFAWELLLMEDIKVSKLDCKKLDIRNAKEIDRITHKEASKLLEKKGWKWSNL